MSGTSFCPVPQDWVFLSLERKEGKRCLHGKFAAGTSCQRFNSVICWRDWPMFKAAKTDGQKKCHSAEITRLSDDEAGI